MGSKKQIGFQQGHFSVLSLPDMLQLTFTEENYLKTIYSIQDKDENGTVSTNQIAEKMNTRPATVTDMLRKLSEKSLIHYQRYKKVMLTDSGAEEALRILRKHRLWETFLHDKLKFSWDEVHEVAEQLEHISSQKLIERLEHFLNYPKFDPHGDPIPDAKGILPVSSDLLLSHAQKDQEYEISGVKDSSPVFLQQLAQLNLRIGTRLQVLERLPFDQSVQVLLVESNEKLMLSDKVCQNITLISR